MHINYANKAPNYTQADFKRAIELIKANNRHIIHKFVPEAQAVPLDNPIHPDSLWLCFKAEQRYRIKLLTIPDYEQRVQDFYDVAHYINTLRDGDEPDFKFPVLSDAAEYSIFDCRETNYEARLAHDIAHWHINAGFSYEQEIQAVQWQVSQIRELARNWYTSASQDDVEFACMLQFADIAGQTMYHQRYGKYVKQQKAFVESCLRYGIEQVLNNRPHHPNSFE
jgi:hypothetical protein